jgi:alanine racemase
MSHLACADEPRHPLNRLQRDRFDPAAAAFPGLPRSLANSAGIHHGPDYHFEMVRPGIALYGGASYPGADSEAVVTAEARILQVRRVGKGDSVGYGAAARLDRDSRIAILGAGYADGLLRAAEVNGEARRRQVWINGFLAPLVGRVSMDLIAVDVTDIPAEQVGPDGWAELFGANLSIDGVADAAGTIAYELLTRLSQRAERTYLA